MASAKLKRKILVHACCMGCFFSFYKNLKDNNFEPIIIFYNPNIHGKSEYLGRLNDLENFALENGIEIIVPKYQISEYFEPIFPYQNKKSLKFISDPDRYKRKRCLLCCQTRLAHTVQSARRGRYKYFTSTLLASPFRNHIEILEIASELANNYRKEFYYYDFRKNYWQGRHHLRAHKLKMPGYCGCVDSIDENILE